VIRFLPDAIVMAIHDDQIRLYGGAYGLRDEAALASALAMPRAQFGGQFLHTDVFAMAAANGYHLSENHPFVDGNKRTAGMAMFTFLKLNGLDPIASEHDYYDAVMAVATRQMGKDQLSEWLRTAVSGVAPSLEE
jgi:death on curing protein